MDYGRSAGCVRVALAKRLRMCLREIEKTRKRAAADGRSRNGGGNTREEREGQSTESETESPPEQPGLSRGGWRLLEVAADRARPRVKGQKVTQSRPPPAPAPAVATHSCSLFCSFCTSSAGGRGRESRGRAVFIRRRWKRIPRRLSRLIPPARPDLDRRSSESTLSSPSPSSRKRLRARARERRGRAAVGKREERAGGRPGARRCARRWARRSVHVDGAGGVGCAKPVLAAARGRRAARGVSVAFAVSGRAKRTTSNRSTRRGGECSPFPQINSTRFNVRAIN